MARSNAMIATIAAKPVTTVNSKGVLPDSDGVNTKTERAITPATIARIKYALRDIATTAA